MAHGGLVRTSGLICVVLGLVATPVVATAGTLRVAANGVDAPGCGPAAAPCRTIDLVIAHATPGDIVIVGPGRYSSATVSKSVTLLSSYGAGTTIVDAEGGSAAIAGAANDATIGRPARGFTVTGADLGCGIRASKVRRVVIAGNNAGVGNAGGICIWGSDNADIEISGNVASHNISVGISAYATGIEIVGNLVQDNGSDGISASVTSSGTIRGNAVTGHALTGIYGVLGTDSVVRDNIVTDNGTGMDISGDVLVTRNAILSNRLRGLVAGGSLGPGGFQGSPGLVIASRNNFYDNGQCDIARYRPGHVDGRNNFWGTRGGPNLNPVCLGSSSTMDTEPFLQREIPLSVMKPRL